MSAGGAICNGGTLTITGSTFTGNLAHAANGGGAIFNYGTLVVSNSTFAANSAPGGVGGAIHNGQLFGPGGMASLNNVTIAGNTAGKGAPTAGGGIFNISNGTTLIQNSIVAGNSAHDCGGALTSEGYNIGGDNTCTFGARGDRNRTNPRLGSLRENGGPTLTMALRANSPAIDSGNLAGCTNGLGRLLKTDQRGELRPDREDGSGCDSGAYEHQGDERRRYAPAERPPRERI